MLLTRQRNKFSSHENGDKLWACEIRCKYRKKAGIGKQATHNGICSSDETLHNTVPVFSFPDKLSIVLSYTHG